MKLISPISGSELKQIDGFYIDEIGNKFPIINSIPRFISGSNYTENFGFQWNVFSKTQLDYHSVQFTKNRFEKTTNWKLDQLDNLDILEVGSGAGRFTKIFLKYTNCNLCSFDYSNAVEANFINNGHYSRNRFNLIQANLYDAPFSDNSFDKVFCLGVLQHTPDFEKSVKTLINKAKIGGEIVVDFYPVRGWWTKIHAKYFFRPFLKKLPNNELLRYITVNINWLIFIFDLLVFFRFGFFTRFLPITDLRGLPAELGKHERRQWAILDTFDGFSPEFDNPKKISDVVLMFENNGAKVTFADYIQLDNGSAAVVRAVKS
jgi:SAM-dependent methyltransferase